MREILDKIGYHFCIWFVFYVSLPIQIKLLLFNIFFFSAISRFILEKKVAKN